MLTPASYESLRPSTLADYLDVLRRRKWLVLPIVVLVPLLAALISAQSPREYEASAQVLLKRQDLTGSLTGVQAPYVDPARAAETEAGLARVPEVARRALARVPGSGLTQREFLKASSISTTFGSDLLTLSVRDERPQMATRLANAYAHAFAAYRRDLDTQEVARTHETVMRRIEELKVLGLGGSGLYRNLVQKERQIAAIQALQTPAAVVVREPDRATRISSQVVRNALLGLVLALLLGLGLAFLVESLDSRIHSVDEIRRTLGLRLLAKLPKPSRDKWDERLVTIVDPMSGEAEGFRILRAGLDFANVELGARTIVLTSALGGEGKSTTVANLAVAMARGGRQVVLADFDLRNPSIHRLFGLDKRPGVIEVQLGEVELEDALQRVKLTDDVVSLDGPGRPTGTLDVLPAGQTIEDPDHLRVAQGIANVVDALRNRGDVVLIDSPPLLPTADARSLLAHVDALVLVVRQDTISSAALRDLGDVLASVPTAALGYVLTGASAQELYSSYRYRGSATTGSGGEPPSADARQPVPAPGAASDHQLASYSYARNMGLDE